MSRTFLKKEMKAFYLKVYRKFKICIQHLFFFLTFNITTYVCDTVKPGISKLFKKHKKFTIARCLLSKGFDQKSNMGIISVLKSS